MAQYSTAVVNAVIDSAESTVGTSPLLIVYSGALPASCASPDPSGVLVTFQLPADWLTAAANGTKVLTGAASQAIASGTGIANCFRVKDSSGLVCAMQGDVTIRGGGGGLTLSSLNIRIGQKVKIGTFTITTQVSALLAVIQANQTLIATATVTSGGGGGGTSTTPFTVFRTGISYPTLQQAHDNAQAGDTIKVTYGVYTGFTAFSTGSPRLLCRLNNLTIEWETPGLIPSFDYAATAQGDANVGGSGAALDMMPECTSLTVRGIEILGSQNGAPSTNFVNVESGYPGNVTPYVLTLEYCSLLNWTNGILTGPNHGGVVNLRYCLIQNCGKGDGLSHGIYISEISTLNVLGCTFRTTPGGVSGGATGSDFGHLFKSRARFCTVDSSIFDGAGGCSRPLDISNGGTYVLRGCFMHKYQDGASGQCIRFGAEQRDGQAAFASDGRTHAFTLEQCTLKNDRSDQILLIDAVTNGSGTFLTVTKTIRNNVAAGTFANDITQFANNAEVQLAQISASGQLNIGSISGTQNDATSEYSGLFTIPVARSDSNMGAFRTGLPSWSSPTLNAWVDIPTSIRMSYTKDDGTGILPAPGNPGNIVQGGHYAQLDSFSGTTWSEKNKELWLFGGGHTATNNNPLVKAVLGTNTPSWVAVDVGSTTGPTGTLQTDWDASSPPNFVFNEPNTPWNNSRFHSDGRPKSGHGYRNNQYLDAIDEFLSVGVASANSPTLGVQQYPAVVGYPRSGGAWRAASFWPALPSIGGGNEPADQCVCVSPDGGSVFRIDTSGGQLWKLNGTTRTFSVVGGSTFHNWMGADLSRMGCNSSGTILGIAIVGPSTNPYTLRFIDSVTGAETAVTASGAAFPSFSGTNSRCVDVVWAEAAGKWYIAFNVDAQNFSGGSGGYSSSWSLYSVQQTSSASATVALVTTTGTAPSFGGTRGGFHYSKDWKSLIAYDGYGRAVKALRIA